MGHSKVFNFFSFLKSSLNYNFEINTNTHKQTHIQEYIFIFSFMNLNSQQIKSATYYFAVFKFRLLYYHIQKVLFPKPWVRNCGPWPHEVPTCFYLKNVIKTKCPQFTYCIWLFSCHNILLQ